METFEQVWEASRTNSYSWIYPALLWSGAAVIFALSFVKNIWIRRSGKVIVILLAGYSATHYSGLEIQEKWRLRGEWADAHPDKVTEENRHALTVDGANRAAGPLFYGGQAILLLVAVSSGIRFLKWIAEKPDAEKMINNEDNNQG